MNYGEDLAYWYLRLNGFFPITNLVVHRSAGVEHRSDIDVLAIRPPHVYEEVGGRPDDWDQYLATSLRFDRPLGIICEVKTGGYDPGKLFRSEHVEYAVRRLGLVDTAESGGVATTLAEMPILELSDGSAIGKLFISNTDHQAGPFFTRTLGQVEDFLADRVHRYPAEKFASRMFFPTGVFQHLIAQVQRAIANRKAT